MTVIALWAHQRSVSTAFLRMMIERGDLTVVHEPLVTLVDAGRVELPLPGGGTAVAESPAEVLARLRALGEERTVFVKDTVEYRYERLFAHPEEVADFRHTFIVRDPRKAIASLYAMKPTATCPEYGYEHLYEIYALARRSGSHPPVVIDADRMLAAPEVVVRAYCAAVGLPFLPHALTWRPGERAEWHRTREWHVEVGRSSGFGAAAADYAITVDNSALLKSVYDHHRPFYERLVSQAI